MPNVGTCHINCDFVPDDAVNEAPELSGPLGNLMRLLFSEAWRTKSHPTNRAATFDLTNLSRDFMRRNVATNHNIPQIALSQ